MIVSVADAASTLPQVVVQHALTDPFRSALTFLADGERVGKRLSYGELVARASAIASELKRRDLVGRPVLLLYPAGTDYLCALLGCFWSGAIAVPAYPPSARRLTRATERIAMLVADAGASAALTNAACLEVLGAAPELASLTMLATDTWQSQATAWEPIEVHPDEPCLLQYTSGSTSAPKGVLLTHAQLFANLEIMFAVTGPLVDGLMVTWLPPYHDMGLLGTLLFPLYRGTSIVQLSPDAFVRRPLRWLRAISEHRAVATATPNFALELCVRRIAPEQRAGLDLSSLRFMFNGSEPIDAATVEVFSKAYAPYGLRADALRSSYGMAEATLLLAARVSCDTPEARPYSTTALQQGRAMAPGHAERSHKIVSCGHAEPAGALRIVDPQRRRELLEREVGEIWAMSPSVGSGYWGRPDDTRNAFHARLADSGEGPFLRTGDLGFLDDGELFVTGRLKDLIIVRGKKHAPQDIERTVQRCSPALTRDAGAAFAVVAEGSERLCVVQEIDHRLPANVDAILDEIARAILDEHDIALHAISLLKRGALLKTSSGKIRRSAVKDAFVAGTLPVVASWQTSRSQLMAAGKTVDESSPAPARDDVRQTRTRLVTGERRASAIENFLRDKLATLAKLPIGAIDIDAPLAQYGVDSLIASELAETLESWLGEPVSSTISYDHPTIRGIARALAGLPAAISGSAANAGSRSPPRTSLPSSELSIAIVGMACRFPGAPDLAAFWELLSRGGDAIGEVPKSRWDHSRQLDGNTPRSRSFGGFVEGIESFDAEFFGLSQREAARMDPQQRMFLEVAWHALEDAGIAPDSLADGDTGVFAAVCGSDHALLHGADLERIDADFGTGHSASVVANRVSYFLDLKGPSLSFDSACASSLVALQAACRSLASGETQLAIVGGVNAVLAPHAGVFFSNARALAQDGRCKTFDKRADGFVRSEGCGVIVLQALPRARAQHNRIYALVAGVALAHSGASNGLMAPSGPGQERVIRDALTQAKLTPDALDYIEAHGVGARLADAVELRALGSVLDTTTRQTPCWVGSVKTNIGHLEAASGIASVIKTALALANEAIPKHLHWSEWPDALAAQELPISVPTETIPWRRSERRRHAGVSTFGFGGSNAHAILSEAPLDRATARDDDQGGSHLLTLSARDAAALGTLALHWADSLSAVPLTAACFTANVGRKHFATRAAFVAADSGVLCDALRTFAHAPETLERDRSCKPRPTLLMLFSEQVPATTTGRALYTRYADFQRAFDRASAWLETELHVSLSRLLCADGPSAMAKHAPGSVAAGRRVALQYALYELLRAWGVTPDRVIGQGAGEYPAACAAGVLDWEEGLCLAVQRAQLMASLVPGAEITRTMRAFRNTLAAVPLTAARVQLTLTSREQTLSPGDGLEREHFARQLYRADDDGGAVVEPNDDEVLLAIGDQAQLLRCFGTQAHGPERDEHAAILTALANLYERGTDIDWQAFERPSAVSKWSLPGYPFQRQHCWLDPPLSAAEPAVTASVPSALRSAHPLLRRMKAPAAEVAVLEPAPAHTPASRSKNSA